MADYPRTIVMKRGGLYRRCFFIQPQLNPKEKTIRNEFLQIAYMSTVGV